MKLSKNKVTPKKLKIRLLLSLFIGLFFCGFVIAGFLWVNRGPEIGSAPSLLRHGFMFNEKVFSLLKSSKRLSVKKEKPPKGKEPRVNGDIGLLSEVDLKNYDVLIESPGKSFKIPLKAFYLLPKSDYATDFRCIEGWSEELHYAGARFSDFMKFYDLGKKTDGTYYSYVGLETPDKEYFVSIDMESMLHPQTVLAWEMNEHPISLENGAPLRLVIPIKYGIKSLKRIGKVIFSDTKPRDYWAERGYDWYSGL